MRKPLLTFLLLISFSAFAATLTMTTATQRENGTALGVSEIKGHNIYCGTVSGDYTVSTFVAGATLPDTIIDPIPGTVVGMNYCTVTTVDLAGLESTYSNEFQNEVTQSLPKPPFIPLGMVIKTTL